MSGSEDRVSSYMRAIAVGLDALAGATTGTERLVASTASGLVHGVLGLLAKHNPEEARRMILDLIQNPVPAIKDGAVADDVFIDSLIASKPE